MVILRDEDLDHFPMTTRRRVEIDAQKLADLKTVTPLATLLELNQPQIDGYHRIATDQADRSFRSSQRAMAWGPPVIVGCFAVHRRRVRQGALGGQPVHDLPQRDLEWGVLLHDLSRPVHYGRPPHPLTRHAVHVNLPLAAVRPLAMPDPGYPQAGT
jgi:hypothetical protein